MKNWRRYEILLPLQFNDDTPVPKSFLAEAVLELDSRFGAVSCETHGHPGAMACRREKF